MQQDPALKKENKLLDILKYVCAVLVLASHCLPLAANDEINFFYGQWFFRFCVPFFLISSGYFFASFNGKGKWAYIRRIALLYVSAELIYLPVYAPEGNVVQHLILGYHHLWYLSALVIALCIAWALEKCPVIGKIHRRGYPVLIAVLIVIGAFYDEYQYVFQNLAHIPFARALGDFVGCIGGSRHALFFALPMLLIGKGLYEHRRQLMKWRKAACILLTAASFGLAWAECVMLRHFAGDGITNDITLVNYLPAVFLFVLVLVYQPRGLEHVQTKSIRKRADFIYVYHVLVMLLADRFAGAAYFARFLLVWLLSDAAARVYQKIAAHANRVRASMDAAASCLQRLDKIEQQLARLSDPAENGCQGKTEENSTEE